MSLKKLILLFAGRLLKKYGMVPEKTVKIKQLELIKKTVPLWLSLFNSAPPAEKKLVVIIFSFNRAFQLNALLESYRLHAITPVSVNLIYKSGSNAHEKAYQEVISSHSDLIESVHREKSPGDFETVLKHLIATVSGSHLLFFVDDIVFIRSFHISDLLNIDPLKTVLSLRMGSAHSYCYTLDKKMPLPPLTPTLEIRNGLSWSWNEGESDWNYPLSVDGHLFSLAEMKLLIEAISFSRPNSFEESLQVFKIGFDIRKGLCFTLPVIINNPANKVQSENNNRAGVSDPDSLLRIWEEGFKIDVAKLSGMKTTACHQEFDYPLSKREN